VWMFSNLSSKIIKLVACMCSGGLTIPPFYFLKISKITNMDNNFLVVDDIFGEKIIDQLYNECLFHFDLNLLLSDYIDVTKSIIDCHGLSLTSDKYFPYSVNCWNVFCLEVKSHVTSYIKNLDIDEYSLIPFSCFAERNVPTSSKGVHVGDRPHKVIDADGQVNKQFIRSIYILKNAEPNSTILINDQESSKHDYIKTIENRLVIFDGTKCVSTHYYPKEDRHVKYSIVFDWYINEPFDVPDWILP